jgi:hypothetical protein
LRGATWRRTSTRGSLGRSSWWWPCSCGRRLLSWRLRILWCIGSSRGELTWWRSNVTWWRHPSHTSRWCGRLCAWSRSIAVRRRCCGYRWLVRRCSALHWRYLRCPESARSGHRVWCGSTRLLAGRRCHARWTAKWALGRRWRRRSRLWREAWRSCLRRAIVLLIWERRGYGVEGGTAAGGCLRWAKVRRVVPCRNMTAVCCRYDMRGV